MLQNDVITWGHAPHEGLLQFTNRKGVTLRNASQFVRWVANEEQGDGWIKFGRSLSASSRLRSILAQACGIVGQDELERFIYSTLQRFFAQYGTEAVAALLTVVSETMYDEATLAEAVLNLGQVRGDAMRDTARAALGVYAASEKTLIAEAATEALEAIASHRRAAL